MLSAETSHYSIDSGLLLRSSSIEEIQRVRLNVLQKHLQHAGKTAFYQRIFEQYGFKAEETSSVEDLQTLPLTDRSHLGQFGSDFTPPGIDIADLSHTSGTTGSPVVVPYTRGDLQRLAYNEAMAFYSAGVRGNDTILLTVTLDRCFIAGLAYYSGALFLGASSIRSGPGQPAHQWQLIQRTKPTVLLGVPTFLLALARWGEEHGMVPGDSGIERIITIGEPVRNAAFGLTPLGELLQKSWQAPIFSSYGATEIETAFGDCCEAKGSHVHPELMVVEIIDENGSVVPNGVAGEVVVTPLGVQGFPLVRFKTGDIARKHSSTCDCGWNTERIGPIEGRISQRLKYKGTTLYPEMIFQALQEIPGSENSYIEVTQTFDLADEITVVIGADKHSFSLDHAEKLLQAHLRVKPRIILKGCKEVIDKTGKGKLRKPMRFFDLRSSASSISDKASDSINLTTHIR